MQHQRPWRPRLGDRGFSGAKMAGDIFLSSQLQAQGTPIWGPISGDISVPLGKAHVHALAAHDTVAMAVRHSRSRSTLGPPARPCRKIYLVITRSAHGNVWRVPAAKRLGVVLRVGMLSQD